MDEIKTPAGRPDIDVIAARCAEVGAPLSLARHFRIQGFNLGQMETALQQFRNGRFESKGTVWTRETS